MSEAPSDAPVTGQDTPAPNVEAPNPDPTPSQRADQPTGDTAPARDDTDWKAKSRTWEDRAKANKDKADKADEERAALDAKLAAVLKAAGLDTAEDPAETARKAAAERDAKDTELRQLRVERAAEKAGRKAGADVDALLDSRGFSSAIGKLDPAADDFTDRLTRAVEKALEDNPRLKAAPSVPARSVPDPSGARDNTGQLTRADLKGMTPEQISEARKAGRLTALMRGTTT